jgi:hypothetical protein
MIIPDSRVAVQVTQAQADAHDLDLLEQNWLWAKQWKEAVPSDRETVSVPVNGDIDRDFLPAVRKAASLASGKYVILFTGHGGRGPTGATVNQITRFQFDTVPEPGAVRLDNHTRAITADVLNFLNVAQQQDGKWVPKPQNMGNVNEGT